MKRTWPLYFVLFWMTVYAFEVQAAGGITATDVYFALVWLVVAFLTCGSESLAEQWHHYRTARLRYRDARRRFEEIKRTLEEMERAEAADLGEAL